jgi:galactonate dehydratase
MIDALWRLDLGEAIQLGRELDARRATWLEAPLKPEDVRGHAQLAAAIDTPVAIGESWRTRWEMKPFFETGGVETYQPDIGRSGISEGMKLCALAELYHVKVALHVSIGLGVQIAAAIHVAAAIPNLLFIECNPQVWVVAEQLLRRRLPIEAGFVGLPSGPGLGIEIDETELNHLINL